MKAILVLLLIAATQNASAQCYNFFAGQEHPSVIVDIQLYGQASRMCVTQGSQHGDDHIQISFIDEIGELAQFSATLVAQARCLQDCDKIYELNFGTVSGKKVDARGIRVEIQTTFDANLNVSNGLLKVSSGSYLPQSYSIIATKH